MQVKAAGVAGLVSYALWEFAFWTISVPLGMVPTSCLLPNAMFFAFPFARLCVHSSLYRYAYWAMTLCCIECALDKCFTCQFCGVLRGRSSSMLPFPQNPSLFLPPLVVHTSQKCGASLVCAAAERASIAESLYVHAGPTSARASARASASNDHIVTPCWCLLAPAAAAYRGGGRRAGWRPAPRL